MKYENIEGLVSNAECKCLYEYAKKAKSCIMEIGSYRGKSTIALAQGSKDGNKIPVYAIEPHEYFREDYDMVFDYNDRGEFMRNIVAAELYDIVRLVNLKSEKVEKAFFRDFNIDLLFIDGDHRYEAVKNDFENWRWHLKEDGKLIFHDKVWPGPKKVIEEILETGAYSEESATGSLTVLKKISCG